MRIKKTLLIIILAIASMSNVLAVAENLSDNTTLRESYRRPLDIPFPKEAPYSPQIAVLGKMLFFDPRLSGSKNMNCATCHNPSFGLEAPVELAVGAANVQLNRHAPTLLNIAWVKPLTWDGRFTTLKNQAVSPITNHKEMNSKLEDIVVTLNNIKSYQRWFNKAFPQEGVNVNTILTSIATYERTLIASWSPFDYWVEGDEDAISTSAKRGFTIFNGKAGCSNCHRGWNFTDNQFHDTGLDSEDIGRGQFFPDDSKLQHAFKTPGLRNLIYRAPFMHNGSLPNIEAVIDHYQNRHVSRLSLSGLLQTFTLNDTEKSDLISFLNALSSSEVDVSIPMLPN